MAMPTTLRSLYPRTGQAEPDRRGIIEKLNTTRHPIALSIFMLIVLAHWAEHIAQAIQLWVLDWQPAKSRGILGQFFPWLVTSETLHYCYALFMLIGLWILRKGFVGRSRQWWNVALVIQVWHHLEHLSLIIQATTHDYLAGRPVQTSVIQLVVPRVELHLFYNSIVTIPMVTAILLHRHASASERKKMNCACAFGVELFGTHFLPDPAGRRELYSDAPAPTQAATVSPNGVVHPAPR